MDYNQIKEKDVLQVLSYPFDANYILSKKKRIKKQLLELNRECIKKNIAILGGYTTNDIKLILELFLLSNGIMPEFYESEYNQFYQDAMFPNKELEEFHPDIIYVCTCNRNITAYPDISDSVESVNRIFEGEQERYQRMWEHLEMTYQCPIIQNNFELPMYRMMGNKDASDIHGAVNYITRLNMSFYEYARQHENFYICDINYIASDYGLKEWSNPFYWYMYKYALNVSAIPYLSFNVANIIKSIFGKNKKGFVLDLDNTLWGGIIGDDGVENIEIGPEESEGQAYLEFQEYLKKCRNQGIVLNINSKNEEENAIAGLNHPNGVLKPEDFIEIKANWEPKNLNFGKIAKNLNLLPESLVFIDDNPAEREIVTSQLRGVSAPEIGEVYQYIQTIDRSGFFEVTSLSKDDLKRNDMYKENVERSKLEASFENYEDYLLSLNMQAVIRPFEAMYFSRIAQLTNKSNQFNLTTKRYTQAEIEEISKSNQYITLYGQLEDKFGDNGVVSVVIGKKEADICHIELWLMSCRVLKRDMEFAMMDVFIQNCKDAGIKTIKGYYYPTSKNKMVSDFYEIQGFEIQNEDSNGSSIWNYRIQDGNRKTNKVIHVKNSERI